MFFHYLKILFRHIQRNKIYTFINLIGLSTGLAASLILLLYIQHEVGFDDFHEKKDQIYRVITKGNKSKTINARSPFKLAPVLKSNFPEIREICRIREMKYVVKKGENFIQEKKFIQVDNSFFSIFTFEFIYGNASNALIGDTDIVITKSTAEKYFPNENPVGKILEILLNERIYQQQITAVIKDFPSNSHIQADFILPIHTTIWSYENINRRKVYPSFESWKNNDFLTYLLVDENFNPKRFTEKIQELIRIQIGKDFHSSFQLQELKRIHLFSDFLISDVANKGKLEHIYLFGIISVLILFIAIINYIILSTTRSLKRIKEIGLRKVMGANRSKIIKLVLGESLFISFLSLPLALIMARLSLPYVNDLLGMSISHNIISNPISFLGLILACLFTGIISGSYIAFYLSSFKPIDVFRSQINLGLKGSFFQKSLIIIQLMIFVGLVICSGVIYNQVKFMKENDVLGFEKENLISIYTHDNRNRFNSKYPSFKTELLTHPNILFVSTAFSDQPSFNTNLSYSILRNLTINGKTKDHWSAGSGRLPEMSNDVKKLLIYEGNSIDFDYLEAMGIKMSAGRSYDKNILSDRKAIIVNEEFIKKFDVQNPLTEKYKFGSSLLNIIGIVKNYHSKSLTEKVKPILFRMSNSFGTRYLSQVIIKTDGQNTVQTLSFIESKWKENCPDAPFIYQFTNTYLDNMYKTEMNLARLIGIFALFAIIIASLGLFGLSLSIAQQKIKEIVIRKTMGASVGNIVYKLLKQFLNITIIANIIIMPLAFYFMDKWLNNFEYQSIMDYRIFIGAGVLSVALCLLTVSFPSAKAAIINPVEALKYE